MKLIKYAVVLGAGAFLMPAPPLVPGAQPDGAQYSEVAPVEMISAARAAIGDISGFCRRQPGVCATAGRLAGKLEMRAKYAIRRAYEWSNADAPPPAARTSLPVTLSASDPLITGSTPRRTGKTRSSRSSGTLTIEDLLPQWRGPARPRSG